MSGSALRVELGRSGQTRHRWRWMPTYTDGLSARLTQSLRISRDPSHGQVVERFATRCRSFTFVGARLPSCDRCDQCATVTKQKDRRVQIFCLRESAITVYAIQHSRDFCSFDSTSRSRRYEVLIRFALKEDEPTIIIPTEQPLRTRLAMSEKTTSAEEPGRHKRPSRKRRQ